jgi:putative ABC transport system permease protein
MLETLSLEQQAVYGVPTLGYEPNSWLLESLSIETDATKADLEQPQTVLLGIHLAERLRLKPGMVLTLFDEPYRVVGVFKSTSVWENGSMILPLERLQQLTDRSGQVTYINVSLEKPASATRSQAAVEAIGALDNRLLALGTREFVQTDTRMQIAHSMAWMTSAIALIIGAIGTWNTMLTSVLERTKEIGILRAIGWPRRRVVSMILLESVGLAIAASLLGLAAAWWLTGALARAPQARGLINPVVDWMVIVKGFGMSVAIGLLGALLPAIRAARLAPTEAFREFQ